LLRVLLILLDEIPYPSLVVLLAAFENMGFKVVKQELLAADLLERVGLFRAKRCLRSLCVLVLRESILWHLLQDVEAALDWAQLQRTDVSYELLISKL
jgi:hypothetical protein